MHGVELFLAAFVQSVAQSAPYLVLGYLIAAVIREWFSLEQLSGAFGSRGLRPVLTAAGIGSLLPMCSCTVIPVAVGLVRSGAARGTVLAFLVTAPALSPISIIMGIGLLGPLYTAVWLGTVAVGAVALGLIGNVLLAAGDHQFRDAVPAPATAAPQLPWPRRVARAVHWAWWDLGSEVSVDLVVGLALAAVVLALLPLDLIASWVGGPGLLPLILVALIGIPLYTCTVPSLPLVQSLLLKGMAPGAGVTFLISGPATNLGELLVLRRSLGSAAMWLFVGGLLVMSIAGGAFANSVVWAGYSYVPNAEPGVSGGCCVVSFLPGASAPPKDFLAAMVVVPWWHWPFAIPLAVCLGTGVVRRVLRWRAGTSAPAPETHP